MKAKVGHRHTSKTQCQYMKSKDHTFRNRPFHQNYLELFTPMKWIPSVDPHIANSMSFAEKTLAVHQSIVFDEM